METRPAWGTPDLNSCETERSRQYSYFVCVALNIRRLIAAYSQARKQDTCAIPPQPTNNNTTVDQLITDLPADLQVVSVSRESSPLLASHYVAGLNIYHHMSIIMRHRPQLASLEQASHGNSWRDHMGRCSSSAKAICHLQEAILSNYGISALSYLQRGIHFTVYSILTCLTVHSVCHCALLVSSSGER